MIEPPGDESDEEADERLGISCEREQKKIKKNRRKLKFEDIPVHIRERVYSDIGEASMCWETPGGCGVFDSTDAARIGLELCQFIIDQIEEAKSR